MFFSGDFKMRTTLKRVLQAVIVLSLVAYMTQVIRQHMAVGEDADPRRASSSSSAFDPFSTNRTPEKSLFQGRIPMEMESGVARELDDNAEHALFHPTLIDDVFISVKTTKNFHKSRLDVILKTWFSAAMDQTFFFTDGEDEEYQRRTGGHLINTNCTSSHNRKALCCKMSVEFDTFLESNKMWFCHFDDDNYVNVPRLVELLQRFNPQEDWYLGKPSIRVPLRIMNRDNPTGPKISFWFATGGAGFCLSRALALKMMPIASNGKFISIGDKIRLPDDVTMGYIIENLLNHNLTVVKEFHSHLEPMKFLRAETFRDQITFSYSQYGKELNIVNIDGLSPSIDPTRFLSLHCHLFTSVSYCPR